MLEKLKSFFKRKCKDGSCDKKPVSINSEFKNKKKEKKPDEWN